jgi:tetratricopeptide (TPR) repeat protein
VEPPECRVIHYEDGHFTLTWVILMLLADRQSILPPILVSELAHHLSSLNQQTFLRLRLALGLGMRRQIMFAVCDDVALRNAMADKLGQDLAILGDLGAPGSEGCQRCLDLDLSSYSSEAARLRQLLTLTLSAAEPNVLGQVLGPAFQPGSAAAKSRFLGIQVLGIEQLTRQPVHIQRTFLNHLRSLGRNVSKLDSNLLLWVTRPWYRSIQQSAPEFWRWHTAVFDFEGEPAPASPPAGALSGLLNSTLSHYQHQLATPPAIHDRPSLNRPIPSTSPLIATSIAAAAPVIRMTDPIVTPADWPNGAASDEDLSHAAGSPPGTRNAAITTRLEQTDRAFTVSKNDSENGSENEIANVRLGMEPTPDCAPLANSVSTADHLEPSAEELELADLVLAAVMQDVARHPEGHAFGPDHAPNLDHPSFAPIVILQQVEALQIHQAEPAAFADVYRQLGDWYRDRAEQEASMGILQIGIRAYELAWRFLEPEAPAVPEILNDIGNLHWMLSRLSEAVSTSLANLQEAIMLYQRALDKTDTQRYPQTCAMLQNNLGAAYSDLAQRRDPIDNLHRSIQAYQAALEARPAAVDPRRYAATQNNLGTAYWNLGQQEQLVVNLQRAIAAYAEALRFYNPDEEPLHYAMIQNNLGTGYWNLAQCDLTDDLRSVQDHRNPPNLSTAPHTFPDAMPEDLLQLAIGSYRVALIYRTLAAAPAAHAATQNNLGTAYWHLANQPATHYEDLQGYLEQAMAAYEAAISAVPVADGVATFDLAATHNNLASAYYQAATQRHAQIDTPTRTVYLEKALQNHLVALQGWQAQPDFQEAALNGVIQTVRACHEQFGMQAQTQALSNIPPHLLPVVMKEL